MHPAYDAKWVVPLLITVFALMVSIGWLDVVRGRELAVLRTDMGWAIREIVRIHEDVETLKRECRGQYTP